MDRCKRQRAGSGARVPSIVVIGALVVIILIYGHADSEQYPLPLVADQVPIDPCQVVRCVGVASTSGSRASASAKILGMKSYRTEPVMESYEVGPAEGRISPADLLWARSCSAAAQKYQPAGETKPDLRYYDQYLSICFKDLNQVSAATRTMLRSTVVLVRVPARFQKCSGLVISSRVLITARHCFLREGEPDLSSDIPMDVQDTALVAGTNYEGGSVWQVEGFRIYVDPYGTTDFARALKNAGKAREYDFLALTPAKGNDKLPSPSPISLVSAEQLGSGVLRQGERLTLPSFPRNETQVRIDDSISCQVSHLYDGSGYFEHYCETLAGSSGAPVFLLARDRPPFRVVGMHRGGWNDRRVNMAGLWPQEFVKELIRRGDLTPQR